MTLNLPRILITFLLTSFFKKKEEEEKEYTHFVHFFALLILHDLVNDLR